MPDGYIVMHVCDNPSCCNPDHLMIGTDMANFCDMLFKNRGEFKKNKAIGTKNVNAKLNDESVREIRSIYKSGYKNQYELAEMFSVSQNTIAAVVNNKTWRHVG